VKRKRVRMLKKEKPVNIKEKFKLSAKGEKIKAKRVHCG
jgi:hypothetical protein